jgi:hypothetical protein
MNEQQYELVIFGVMSCNESAALFQIFIAVESFLAGTSNIIKY